MTDHVQALKKILGLTPLGDLLGPVFEQMDWADDEIEKAKVRHGETKGDGLLWGAFGLLRRSNVDMYDEIIYRAHAREILERMAAGHDLRPGTDAEMITVLRGASLKAPFTSSAACLYFRIAARSFPEIFAAIRDDIDLPAYEVLHGAAADNHQSILRAKLTTDRELL